MNPPNDLKDSRQPNDIIEDFNRANEYAEPGTVKHFALRSGFFPHDEEDAEKILSRIIREWEWFATMDI